MHAYDATLQFPYLHELPVSGFPACAQRSVLLSLPTPHDVAVGGAAMGARRNPRR